MCKSRCHCCCCCGCCGCGGCGGGCCSGGIDQNGSRIGARSKGNSAVQPIKGIRCSGCSGGIDQYGSGIGARSKGNSAVQPIKGSVPSSVAEPEPVEPKLFGDLEPEQKIGLNKHFLQSVW